MKVKSLNCPDCGASLNMKGNSKRATCEYCGGQVFIQDNTMTVKHLQSGDITEEQEYINAETNLNKLKHYIEAYKGYKALSKRYVDDPSVWIGLLRSYSNDFTRQSYDIYYQEDLTRFWKNFESLATENEIAKYKDKYEKYLSEIVVVRTNVKEAHEEALKENSIKELYMNNPAARLIVTMFFGILGIHKFLEGKYGLGVVYLFTYGLFGIGVLMDIIKEIINLSKANK